MQRVCAGAGISVKDTQFPPLGPETGIEWANGYRLTYGWIDLYNRLISLFEL